jgi:phosphatidylserine/phosphatidylglycerophosphate/cardiolipin synthase-like enzyme
VHSKVSIVDDKWATIGTANLDGSSLSGAEEFKHVTDPKTNINMEINALILDLDEQSTRVNKFREELWEEHLGLSLLQKPRKGWLKLWYEVATNNVKSLKMDELISRDIYCPTLKQKMLMKKSDR